VPMLLLFEGSIWLSVLFERRWSLATRGRELQSAS
jgi:Sec-independent protein secretion pathway component TatC